MGSTSVTGICSSMIRSSHFSSSTTWVSACSFLATIKIHQRIWVQEPIAYWTLILMINFVRIGRRVSAVSRGPAAEVCLGRRQNLELDDNIPCCSQIIRSRHSYGRSGDCSVSRLARE